MLCRIRCDFIADPPSDTTGLRRGGDAQGHGHEEHMPEHNGHLFGEEARDVSRLFHQ